MSVLRHKEKTLYRGSRLINSKAVTNMETRLFRFSGTRDWFCYIIRFIIHPA